MSRSYYSRNDGDSDGNIYSDSKNCSELVILQKHLSVNQRKRHLPYCFGSMFSCCFSIVLPLDIAGIAFMEVSCCSLSAGLHKSRYAHLRLQSLSVLAITPGHRVLYLRPSSYLGSTKVAELVRERCVLPWPYHSNLA